MCDNDGFFDLFGRKLKALHQLPKFPQLVRTTVTPITYCTRRIMNFFPKREKILDLESDGTRPHLFDTSSCSSMRESQKSVCMTDVYVQSDIIDNRTVEFFGFFPFLLNVLRRIEFKLQRFRFDY